MAFDLSSAKRTAADADEELVDRAAGSLSNELDKLITEIAEGKMTAMQKVTALNAVQTALAERGGLQAMVSGGSRARTPLSLMGGVNDPAQAQADLQLANDKIAQLEQELATCQAQLRAIMLDAGVPVPPDPAQAIAVTGNTHATIKAAWEARNTGVPADRVAIPRTVLASVNTALDTALTEVGQIPRFSRDETRRDAARAAISSAKQRLNPNP